MFKRQDYIVRVELRIKGPGTDAVRTLNVVTTELVDKGEYVTFQHASLGLRTCKVVGYGRKHGFNGPLKLAWRKTHGSAPSDPSLVYYAGACRRHRASEQCKFCMGDAWPRQVAGALYDARVPKLDGSRRRASDPSDVLDATTPMPWDPFEPTLARITQEYLKGPACSPSMTAAFVSAVERVGIPIDPYDAKFHLPSCPARRGGDCSNMAGGCSSLLVAHSTAMDARATKPKRRTAGDDLPRKVCADCTIFITDGSGNRKLVCTGGCMDRKFDSLGDLDPTETKALADAMATERKRYELAMKRYESRALAETHAAR